MSKAAGSRGVWVEVGEAVRRTKLRYYLETPRFDAYDEKSLMQWTLFGLPMYAVKTGIGVFGTSALGEGLETELASPEAVKTAREPMETYGAVTVTRGEAGGVSAPVAKGLVMAAASLPSYLTRLDLSFDFTAPGVYTKRNSLGDELPDDGSGCADPNGCYFTLNGLVERATGSTDLPLQPYFIYDSRLSGTSQHGVLWKGGQFQEESGWVPVVAELASNGGDFSNHGDLARVASIFPRASRLGPLWAPRSAPQWGRAWPSSRSSRAAPRPR